jgi:hypothetical protein
MTCMVACRQSPFHDPGENIFKRPLYSEFAGISFKPLHGDLLCLFVTAENF